MTDNIFQKFRDKFIDEANMLLDKLEKDLLELEKTPGEKELLESAFRAMHTIKGVSSMYGFDFITEFTHILENIYQKLRDKDLIFNKEISDISFQAIDHIRKLLDDEKLENPENKEKHTLIQQKICVFVKDTQPAEKVIEAPSGNVGKKQSWYIILRANEQIMFRGVSLINIFKELAHFGEFHVQKIPILSDAETESWGIVLISECAIEDIREVFMFIEDDCQIFRITDSNIFEPLKSTDSSKASMSLYDSAEPSMLDLINTGNELCFENPLDKKQTFAENSKTNQKQNIKRISVDAIKLDQLMYLVSELITVNSQLLEAAKDSQYEALRPHLENVDSLSKKFRNNALEIRLVPLSDIALRFQRLIRDLSSQLGKKIEFITEGIDTELDKNMIDMLAEPLMHIIRNCIDHGIESPENRIKQSKPETGTIKLSAVQSGNLVLIKISDDGNGIDLEKVRLKAVEKEIISVNDKPTEKEIYDFIFMPGFSTANSLTEVSGRGVGMDIVKKKIADLRGEIIVESVTGKGTSFTLKLQQSVAILDTLLFRVEDTYLIVPMSDIEICIQEDTTALDKRRHMGTIQYNDQLINFIDLREKLEISGSYRGMVKMVIVRNVDNKVALLADKIIGEHQAVLKPLGKTLQEQKFLLAASQLGDGNLAFMLDTFAL